MDHEGLLVQGLFDTGQSLLSKAGPDRLCHLTEAGGICNCWHQSYQLGLMLLQLQSLNLWMQRAEHYTVCKRKVDRDFTSYFSSPVKHHSVEEETGFAPGD